MGEEATMDEAETRITPDIDGDATADEIVSNGDLANRRRRQQVRQACQQCRRRKIKVTYSTARGRRLFSDIRYSATRFDLYVDHA